MQSSSRNGATVRVLALHTTEGMMRATQLRDWAGWSGSSHAAADETGALLDGAADGFVDHDRAAWTLRNGNTWSENLELCAWASWTRQDWLDRPPLLEAAARWLARRSQARGIPLRKLTVAELRAGHWGVIDHDDYSDATGDGAHWDVGESFPWDVVMPRAIALAGPAPAPIPTRRRRRRTMDLTRDTSTGAVYLVDPAGLRHLQTDEEVNVCGWLLDDTRAANATLQHNARFHDVLLTVLAREYVQRRVGVGAAARPLAPPSPVDDPEKIGPPPGFDVFALDARDHG